MGCCNCKETEFVTRESRISKSDRRDDFLQNKRAEVKEKSEITFDSPVKKNPFKENLSTNEVKGNKFDESTYGGHIQDHFDLQENDMNYVPETIIGKGDIGNREREYSASFNFSLSPSNFKPNPNQFRESKRINNLIVEIDSRAEDLNKMTFKNKASGNTLNSSVQINSPNNKHEKNCLEYKHFNGEKILLQHSLNKNKTPHCHDIPKKHLNNSNIDIIHDKPSFISINKETITKYKHLFSDVEEASMKNTTRRDSRFNISKNISNFEDSDFTTLQKYGTLYSTSKTMNIVLSTEIDTKKSSDDCIKELKI